MDGLLEVLSWVGHGLYTMPSGLGALIGALVGFGGLIAVTWMSYRNLINAQENKAKLEREAEDAQLVHDRRTLAIGLHGELKTALKNVQGIIQSARNATAKYKDLEEGADGDFITRITFDPYVDATFFNAVAGKVGLLGLEITGEVCEYYGLFAFWRHEVETHERNFPTGVRMSRLVTLLRGKADQLTATVAAIENLTILLDQVARGEQEG